MWKIITLFLLVAILPIAYGTITYYQSTHSGPFAYFHVKYPDMTEKKMVDAAEQEILNFAKNAKDALSVQIFMEKIGFVTEVFQGDELRRQMVSTDKISKYRFSYMYGFFRTTHAWIFSLTVDEQGVIDARQPFQVCTACP